MAWAQCVAKMGSWSWLEQSEVRAAAPVRGYSVICQCDSYAQRCAVDGETWLTLNGQNSWRGHGQKETAYVSAFLSLRVAAAGMEVLLRGRPAREDKMNYICEVEVPPGELYTPVRYFLTADAEAPAPDGPLPARWVEQVDSLVWARCLRAVRPVRSAEVRAACGDAGVESVFADADWVARMYDDGAPAPPPARISG